MYIVTCNSAHKDTITIFGTFKTIFGAKGFLKQYKENVEAFINDPVRIKYEELKKEIASEDFKKKIGMFPNDRILNSKLIYLKKYEKSVNKLAKLHGIEITDKGVPFTFTEDSSEYIHKIDYPINITIAEEPNWRNK